MSTTFTIDRFAAANNTLCTLYNSQFVDIAANGIDAFAQDNYALHVNFFNPPISIMGRVTCFIIDNLPATTRLAIIFPMWEA